MTNLTFRKSGRSVLLVAAAAFAPLAVGQMNGMPGGSNPSGSEASWHDWASSNAATMSAAGSGGRQESLRGAQGPIRTDTLSQPRTDPSIRDTNPLTVNGLWETLPGNRIRSTAPE